MIGHGFRYMHFAIVAAIIRRIPVGHTDIVAAGYCVIDAVNHKLIDFLYVGEL